MNEVYAEFFSAPYPARSCFQVGALPAGQAAEHAEQVVGVAARKAGADEGRVAPALAHRAQDEGEVGEVLMGVVALHVERRALPRVAGALRGPHRRGALGAHRVRVTAEQVDRHPRRTGRIEAAVDRDDRVGTPHGAADGGCTRRLRGPAHHRDAAHARLPRARGRHGYSPSVNDRMRSSESSLNSSTKISQRERTTSRSARPCGSYTPTRR